MNFFNVIVDIFQTYIVGQPFIFLSLIAMFGLILQKKTIDKVISGSLKTGIGYLILNMGTSAIASVVLPIATLLNKIIGIEAQAPGIGTNAFTEEWAPTIAIIMVIGFFVNLILARLTPFKYVYLTVHQTYYMTFVYLAVAVEVFGAACHSTLAMIIGGVLLGIYCTLAPAIAQPFVRKVSGSDDFAYGHTTTTGVVVGSLVGSIFKNHKDESSEDLKINPKLNFLKDITVSTAVVMTILYVIATLLAGTSYVETNLSSGQPAILWAICSGVQFGVGITVVLAGVSMMVAEITEAFKGISEKVVPDAIPALDCPIVFNFAPTAVMLGFLSCLGTVIICTIIFGVTGIYALTPPVITTFFGGGPAGVFGNSRGGWRGAVAAGIVAGLLLSFGQLFTVGALPTTVADFARWSNDFDYSVFPALFKAIISLFK
jgi:ascorbate PTS system EIIC component